MKNLFCFLLVIVLLACGEETNPAISEANESLTTFQIAVLEGIYSEGHPIQPIPLNSSDDQLQVLDELANTRIVGLGEATHGTKEFFQMKHRVFQYLVEKHGFTAFLFEMDMAEARIFNDWVQGRSEGSIQALMLEKMIFWTWRTEEVADLLTWMRDYNRGKSEEEMIGIYGVDVQFPIYNLDQLVEIVEQVDAQLANSLLNVNTSYRYIYETYQRERDDALIAENVQGLKQTREIVESLYDQIEAQLGEQEAKWALQLVRHMEQVHQVTFDGRYNNRYYQRDEFMADNTLWFFDLLGEQAKLVLWAHNGHVANDFQYGGIYGGSQGNYLRNELGDDYQIIGFSFTQGTLTAVQEGGPLTTHLISVGPKTDSYNYLLDESSLNNFVLKTKSSHPELDEWISVPRTLLMVGSVYRGSPGFHYRALNLSQHYDYIIHFDETNHTDLID